MEVNRAITLVGRKYNPEFYIYEKTIIIIDHLENIIIIDHVENIIIIDHLENIIIIDHVIVSEEFDF